MEERHLSLSEVAGTMGVSERTVHRWIKSGKLKSYKPGREHRIPESSLRAFIEESEVRAPKDLEPSLPFEPAAAGGNDQRPDLRMLATLTLDLTDDIEEWFLSETRHVGGDAGELPEQDFLFFAGAAGGFAKVQTRIEKTLKEILPAARASGAEAEVERVERAWKRLTVMLGDMVTPKLMERMHAIVDQEEGAENARTNLVALEGMRETA